MNIGFGWILSAFRLRRYLVNRLRCDLTGIDYFQNATRLYASTSIPQHSRRKNQSFIGKSEKRWRGLEIVSCWIGATYFPIEIHWYQPDTAHTPINTDFILAIWSWSMFKSVRVRAPMSIESYRSLCGGSVTAVLVDICFERIWIEHHGYTYRIVHRLNPMLCSLHARSKCSSFETLIFQTK